jgi:hypothetical protein
MEDRDQIETRLREYRHVPRDSTRRAAVDAFERQQRRGGRPSGYRRPWSRTVPAYLAIGLMAVAAGLAFVAGRYTAAGPGALAGRDGGTGESGPAEPELTWSIAVQDQF